MRFSQPPIRSLFTAFVRATLAFGAAGVGGNPRRDVRPWTGALAAPGANTSAPGAVCITHSVTKAKMVFFVRGIVGVVMETKCKS